MNIALLDRRSHLIIMTLLSRGKFVTNVRIIHFKARVRENIYLILQSKYNSLVHKLSILSDYFLFPDYIGQNWLSVI